jgi:hypothetical protein
MDKAQAALFALLLAGPIVVTAAVLVWIGWGLEDAIYSLFAGFGIFLLLLGYFVFLSGSAEISRRGHHH